jgi:MFS family permease
MAALAFLARNIGLGMVFATYGVLLPRICEEFSASRAAAASALSVYMMMFGLIAPFVGMALARFGLRPFMVTGAAIGTVALALAAFADDVKILILLYAFIGIGSGLVAVVAPIALVSRWFHEKRGMMLGIVDAPIFILLSPMTALALLKIGGLQAVFLTMAGLFGLLTIFMFFIVDGPEHTDAPKQATPAPSPAPRAFMRQPKFWILTVAIAMMASAGTALFAHGIGYMVEKGLALESSTLIFSVLASTGLIGTLLFGWLCDRIRPVPTLILNAAVQLGLWTLLVFLTDFDSLVVIAACIGMCMPSLNTIQAAALAHLFGVESVPRAIGISYFVKVPFLLTAAPAAGHVFDVTRSYDFAFTVLASVMLVALVAFVIVEFLRGGRASSTQPAVA